MYGDLQIRSIKKDGGVMAMNSESPGVSRSAVDTHGMRTPNGLLNEAKMTGDGPARTPP